MSHDAGSVWPELNFDDWKDTCATLHLWTQIVGKVRTARTPWINHSWHVTLYVTARGLTTSPIPHGSRTFQIDFDFVDHELRIMTSAGGSKAFALKSRSVAEFYEKLMSGLDELGVPVRIHGSPNEVAEAKPFAEDHEHASYDPEYANRFWRAMVQVDRVFTQFRSRFLGKVSPAHFFWGSNDFAITRFSGRKAPTHPGGFPNLPDWITREAYSHEVSSCGFYPGSVDFPKAIFYSYAYPEPDGFAEQPVAPVAAQYSADMKEFILPYDAVRSVENPCGDLLSFMQTTYEAAANRAGWDRQALEHGEPWPPK